MSAARNRGIEEANAELIAFLDADDEWKPNHLDVILRLYRKYPNCGAYSTSYEVIDPTDQILKLCHTDIPDPPWEGIIPNYFKSALNNQPVIWSSTVVIPKNVFDMVGLFPVGELLGEDLDMWCRIALEYPIAFSTEVCACYHQEADLRACNTWKLVEYQLNRTTDNFLKTGKEPHSSSQKDLIKYKNKMHIHCAINCLFNDMGSKARIQLRQCILSKENKLFWVCLYIISYMPKYAPHMALRLKLYIEKCCVKVSTFLGKITCYPIWGVGFLKFYGLIV